MNFSCFLERHRRSVSWTIAIFFLISLLLHKQSPSDSFFQETMEQSGYIFIFLAALGRIWSSIYISGVKNKKLVQDGPYSLCRNPLYVFSFLGALGVMLGAKIFSLSLLIIPVYWSYYHFVIKVEEKRLEEIFGEEFKNYQKKVPRVIPRFHGYQSRSEITIHPRLVTNTMLNSLCFIGMIVFLEFLENLKPF